MQNEKIVWNGPEHSHKERSSDWYLAVGIISVAIALAAILFKNYIFAILIVLATFTLMLSVSSGPREIEVSLDNRGIYLNRSFFDYRGLESFWIEEESEIPKIIIKSRKLLMHLIVLPIYDVPIEDVREVLSQFLEEEQLHEPFIQKLIEFIGF